MRNARLRVVSLLITALVLGGWPGLGGLVSTPSPPPTTGSLEPTTSLACEPFGTAEGRRAVGGPVDPAAHRPRSDALVRLEGESPSRSATRSLGSSWVALRLASASVGANQAAASSTFPATEDSWVRSTHAATNYATHSVIAAKKDTERMYFKFKVTGVGSVASAVLRLHHNYGTSVNGPRVYKASNSWSETGLTWNNQPALGTLVADFGTMPSTAPSNVEVDVTSAVTGDGEITFQLVGDVGSQVQFRTRETGTAANRPQLIVTYDQVPSNCVVKNTYSSTITQLFSFAATQQPSLLEPSGLAASRLNSGILYTHNEDDNWLFAYNSSGVYKKFNMSIPASSVMDLEDISTGPCSPGSSSQCIWVGDIGKNSAGFPASSKTSFRILRIDDPDVSSLANGATVSVTAYPFTYSGVSGGLDSEALMVHPTTGDIYVVAKDGTSGRAAVYKYPMPLSTSSKALTRVGYLTIPSNPDLNAMRVTAATIHPCADRVLVRTYRNVYEYRASGGFETAFAANPVSLPQQSEGQGESVEYASDGTAYFTQSEETGATSGNRRVHKVTGN